MYGWEQTYSVCALSSQNGPCESDMQSLMMPMHSGPKVNGCKGPTATLKAFSTVLLNRELFHSEVLLSAELLQLKNILITTTVNLHY